MTPDALHTLASKVEREWGSYGYSFESVQDIGGGAALALVSHYDGSHFWVASDRYGVTTAHGDTRESCVTDLRS